MKNLNKINPIDAFDNAILGKNVNKHIEIEAFSRDYSSTYPVNDYAYANTPQNYLMGIYQKLGFIPPGNIPYTIYSNLFERDSISHNLCTWLPESIWFPAPIVREFSNKTNIPKTKFEIDINRILRKTNFFYYLYHADVMANIGQFSAMFVSYNDKNPKAAKDKVQSLYTFGNFEAHAKLYEIDQLYKKHKLEFDVQKSYESVIGNSLDDVDWDVLKKFKYTKQGASAAINYVYPYSQPNAWPSGFDYSYDQPTSATVRWYNLCSNGAIFGSDYSQTQSIQYGAVLPTYMNVVHGSRVIHIVKRNFSNNIYGVPYLEPVFNDILCHIILSGGATRIFEFNAGGYFSITNKTADNVQLWTDKERVLIQNEANRLAQSLTRVAVGQNIDLKSLEWHAYSPKDALKAVQERICAYDKRSWDMIAGTEKGHISAETSRDRMQTIVEIEKLKFATPIIQKFVDLLIKNEVIHEPETDYDIYYPPLTTENSQQQSEKMRNILSGLGQLLNSQSKTLQNYEKSFIEKACEVLDIKIDNEDVSLNKKDYSHPLENITDQRELFNNQLVGEDHN